MTQQQNKQMSPIWHINLFERRQFRNGHSEAQCLECGQSFGASDLAAMTAHIVQKHAEYAAKLLAKQLEFGPHHNEQHQQMSNTAAAKAEECPISAHCQSASSKIATDGQTMGGSAAVPCPGANPSLSLAPVNSANKENYNSTEKTATDVEQDDPRNNSWHLRNENGTATPFSTIMPSPSPSESVSNFRESEDTAMPNLLNQQDTLEQMPLPATPPILSPSVGNCEHFRVPSPATPPLASSSVLSTTVAEDSSNCSTVFPTTQTTTPNANQMGKKGAIYVDRFGKEWHLLVAAVVTNGQLQQQLDQIAGKHFLRRKGPPKYDGRIYFNCRLSDQRQKCPFRGLFLPARQALFIRRTHNHPTTPSSIISSSVALPNIAHQGNFEGVSVTGDCKDHLEKIGDTGTEMGTSQPYFDAFGQKWHWLFNLDDFDEHKEQIQQFCRAHFLTKSGRASFSCKFSRRNSTRGIFRCPYRALYVPERRAMFAFQSHNHPPPEEPGNDTAANEAAGCFPKCCQQPRAVASTPVNSQMGKTVQFDATDDYFDNKAKRWKFMTKIDLGGCETFEERTLLRIFCREHGLARQKMIRYADGALRAYSLTCKEKNANNSKCPYRAVYVVDRRAVFDRNLHNHPTPVGKKDSPMNKMASTTSAYVFNPTKSPFASHPTSDHFLKHFSPQTKAQQKEPPPTRKATLSSSFSIEENGIGCASVSSAAVATVSPNPAQTGYGGNYGSDGDNDDDYVDSVGKRWKFMTTIDAGKCETYPKLQKMHSFCREHGLRQSNLMRDSDGTLRVYSMYCKEVHRNIQCPFRAVYVVKRGAVFVRGVHDHTTLKEKKQRRTKKTIKTILAKRRAAVAKLAMAKTIATSTAANSLSTPPASSTNVVADQSLMPLNGSPPSGEHGQQSDDGKHFGTGKDNDDENATAAVSTAHSNENGHQTVVTAACKIVACDGDVECHADYLDYIGKSWKWLAHIDVGECKTDEERERLRDFCREHGLHRGDLRFKSDGTLRLLALICKEAPIRKSSCPYRAIYVVARRAIFEWASHVHTKNCRKRKLRRQPPLLSKKIKREERLTTDGILAEQSGTSVAHNQQKPLALKAKSTVGDCLSITALSLSDQKPPPVLVDHFGRLWHWLADVPDTDDGTLRDLLYKHNVHKAAERRNGMLVYYRCRHRLSPICCPFKLVHVPAKMVLYQRMHHNHPIPLSTELTTLYNHSKRKMAPKSSVGTARGRNRNKMKKQRKERKPKASGIGDKAAANLPISIKTISSADEREIEGEQKQEEMNC